ncbi:uncharacterized protein LOC104585092 [Brachypodium distachyon]|uniref:uncharacterized protein LOC104585092 n=1 Tax=Brachypodium distachyon TaxID=15368 RepID=UPI0005300059|nr:uncharacterized protein LOC104585092 [Brachypodium distachyon]|eukprot:XP_010239357.1 uncharacterized protein LOC104585092 [Brachypodium distachyon]
MGQPPGAPAADLRGLFATQSAGVLFSSPRMASASAFPTDTSAALAEMLAAHRRSRDGHSPAAPAAASAAAAVVTTAAAPAAPLALAYSPALVDLFAAFLRDYATASPVALPVGFAPPVAPAPSPVPTPASSPAPSPAPPQNLQHVTIRHHISTTLSMQPANYTLWSTVFRNIFGKFAVEDHVDAALAPLHPSATWLQNDCTIVSWLYTTVSEEILTIILAPRDTTIGVWTKIEELFLDNKVTRAVYLDSEFHSIRQGAMSVTAYCSCLKTIAGNLRELGKAVPDKDLVHSTLRGLRKELRHVIPIITREVPLPSFQSLRSFLQLEETRAAKDDNDAPMHTALHVSTAPVAPAPAAPVASTASTSTPSKSKNKGR